MKSVVALFLLLLGGVLLQNRFVEAVTGAGGAEMVVIPNTNLLTGVYYRIGLANYYFSVLTSAAVTVPGNPTSNFVQMDDHEHRLQDYAKGGKWYRDGLWYFKPSDELGFYTLHNFVDGVEKILSVSALEVSPESAAPADHYLVESSLDSIGQNYTLWEALPADGIHTYSLRNFGLPGLAATTLRFGSFYRYARINPQADLGHESFSETDSTNFKFKAIAVTLPQIEEGTFSPVDPSLEYNK